MAYTEKTRKEKVESIERGQASLRWFSTSGLIMFGIFAVSLLFQTKITEWPHNGFLIATLSFLIATVTQWRWYYKYKNRN